MAHLISENLIQLGQSVVSVRNFSESVESSLQFLLHDLKKSQGAPSTTFLIRDIKEGNNRFQVSRDEEFPHNTDTVGKVCTYLIGEIIYHLIDKNSTELLLHAACLTFQNNGLLLPGVSGAGKSTLTSWLLENGFGYITDEIVSVNLQSLRVEGLSRPLNIKHRGMDAIRKANIGNLQNARIIDGSISHLVEHRAFNPNFTPTDTSVKVVIFPRYSATEHFSLNPISTAKVALLLMQAFVNARNHTEHGFHDITTFARSVKGFELTYSNFNQLDELKNQILPFLNH